MRKNNLQEIIKRIAIILVLIGFVICIIYTSYLNIVDFRRDTFSLLFLIDMLANNWLYRSGFISIVIGCIMFWTINNNKKK